MVGEVPKIVSGFIGMKPDRVSDGEDINDDLVSNVVADNVQIQIL